MAGSDVAWLQHGVQHAYFLPVALGQGVKDFAVKRS
jgi:hypothetical protein